METNPKDYNIRASWTPRQQQLPGSRNTGLTQHSAGQKPRAPEKMPRARALALANSLKRLLAVASIVGFGMFGGLVAMHQVSTTTTQSTQSTSGSSNPSSKSSSSSQNNNNFLNQQGGNTSGTNSSSSTPVTGTSTS